MNESIVASLQTVTSELEALKSKINELADRPDVALPQRLGLINDLKHKGHAVSAKLAEFNNAIRAQVAPPAAAEPAPAPVVPQTVPVPDQPVARGPRVSDPADHAKRSDPSHKSERSHTTHSSHKK